MSITSIRLRELFFLSGKITTHGVDTAIGKPYRATSERIMSIIVDANLIARLRHVTIITCGDHLRSFRIEPIPQSSNVKVWICLAGSSVKKVINDIETWLSTADTACGISGLANSEKFRTKKISISPQPIRQAIYSSAQMLSACVEHNHSTSAYILSFIRRYEGKTVVIQCGGSTMSDPGLRSASAQDVVLLHRAGIHPIVVCDIHSVGGNKTNSESRKAFRSKVRASTEDEINEIKTTYCRKAQNIVDDLNRLGVKAVDVNEAAFHYIHAKIIPLRDKEGNINDTDVAHDVEYIDIELINLLSARHRIPVIMSIGKNVDGFRCCISPDSLASKLAGALCVEKIVYTPQAAHG